MSDHTEWPPMWTDADGNVWACGVYDHGPMCRLCQPVDDLLASLLENVHDGYMTWNCDSNGQFRFKMTDAGNEHVHDLVSTNPEAFAIWMRAQGREVGGE